jgi:type VI protein secretion system component Hcp
MLTMEEALITSISPTGNNGENPVETVSFAYVKISFGFNPEDNKGKLKGFVTKGFDMTTLKGF